MHDAAIRSLPVPLDAAANDRPEHGSSRRATGNQIVFGDNLAFLQTLAPETVDLIYIDPPFNTGKKQTRVSIRTVRDDDAPDRFGFKGQGYRTTVLGAHAFDDVFDDYVAFLRPRLLEAHRVLRPNGSLFFHIDYREVHYCKLLLDRIFGRASFINEIIWSYDFGARSRRRWSAKHDNILWYAKDPEAYTFNFDDMDRIPYMAPGLVGPEKAARGKTPTDTWWQTIVSPTGREKTGYPTQKPIAILERIVKIHSSRGDTVLDFFAGSGTTGDACARLGRRFILVDKNPAAIDVMRKRLERSAPEVIHVSSIIDRAGVPSVAVSESKANEALRQRVHIIAVAVSAYDHMDRLRGPAKDLDHIKELFSDSSALGLYDEATLEILRDPTLEELRATLVEYAMSRSAKGDVLIFYFSGHGCVIGGNEFGFCLKDTRVRDDKGAILALTVLGFSDFIQTVCSADVHPIVIIDACYSGAAASDPVVNQMHDSMHRGAASSYALLASCHADRTAGDTADGGEFTKTLLAVAQKGLSDEPNRRKSQLRLSELSRPIQDELERNGTPLSKFYLGPDLPDVPIVRNVAFQPRAEKFATYLRDIVVHAWNKGKPREITIAEIDKKLGKSAYGNHNKLRYVAPWALMENGAQAKSRKLTQRGIDFADGNLKIPEDVVLDPDTNEYVAATKTRMIGVNDL